MANKAGRPRNKPQSASALRMRSLEYIERSQERFKDERVVPLEVLKDKVEALSTRRRYTAKEIEELRDVVALMYQDFQAEQEEMQAMHEASLNAALKAVSIDAGITGGKTITEAEWHTMHGRRSDGSQQRGPKPKRKKLVWELEPGERGNAEEPAAPIDIDAMEKQFESQLMDQHIQDKKEEQQFLLGKRLRDDKYNHISSVNQSKFYQ